ncbi:PadR family transcriptional regulator [Haliangium sp.]|uniref:PadR family transcriptional regulator n=1 Tax=Haliangium sp. TaxID=2663208 RepID=UPI003D14EDBE
MSLRAAILGFLRLEPTSGYVLRQRFEGSVGSFWSVTQSQIYRELHALAADGKVEAEREVGDGKPDRKVYRLTKTGEAALAEWLRAPVEPQQLRHTLLLKFVFAADVEPKVLDQVLENYERTLDATRQEYMARASAPEIFSLARNKREALLWRLSIEHGIEWVDMELRWIRRARGELGGAARSKRKGK